MDDEGGVADRREDGGEPAPLVRPFCLLREDCFGEDERRVLCLTEEALERCSTFTLCTPDSKLPAALLTREEPFSTFGTTRARC